jgi:hypothetical protein
MVRKFLSDLDNFTLQRNADIYNKCQRFFKLININHYFIK